MSLVQVPNYKHGKYYCKPVKKNRSKGKKKKCVFKCDDGFQVKWQNSESFVFPFESKR